MATSYISTMNNKRFAFKNGVYALGYCFGYITNSGTELYLNCPIPYLRRDDNVDGISFSISGSSFKISIRHVGGGYIGSADYEIVGNSSVTKAITWGNCFVRLVLTRSSGWGVTNNTPVAGTISGSVKLG